MREVLQKLKNREQYLTKIKEEKIRNLKHAPEGHLRICKNKNRTQYFWRTDPKDFTGRYINNKNYELPGQLAQKDYDQKIISLCEKEISLIYRFVHSYPDVNIEELCETMHAERQKLIYPIRKSDIEFIEEWQKAEYQGKEFYADSPEIYTLKGERVRSKSEMMIADMLNQEGIPYRYEYPMYLKGMGKIYPDFTVLNVRQRKEYIWEHFGMMDDPVYAEKAIRKVIGYEENGIFPGQNLILTYESGKYPVNQRQIRMMIQKYLI